MLNNLNSFLHSKITSEDKILPESLEERVELLPQIPLTLIVSSDSVRPYVNIKDNVYQSLFNSSETLSGSDLDGSSILDYFPSKILYGNLEVLHSD
jgi:hypothetical protein